MTLERLPVELLLTIDRLIDAEVERRIAARILSPAEIRKVLAGAVADVVDPPPVPPSKATARGSR